MFECDCPPDDCAEKVSLFLAGRREAGDELVGKFQGLVRSIVQKVLGPARREEWDDACQAVFLRVFANLGRWEQRCPFCKWLAVVAARRVIDISRLPNARAMERLPAAELADPRPPPAAGTDRETVERIEQAVARFPPEWRQLWELWKEGTPREKMAQHLGKSVRTIQYWLAEMFEQLRECLGE
jgi:RNA polymerase sigma-70 factor (ECF subfamily)